LAKPRRDVWTLPDVPRPAHAGALVVALSTSPMWGVEKKVSDQPPPEDTRWRLAGIFGQGAHGGAVVMFLAPGKPPLRLHVGDELPDGRRIEAVIDRELLVREGKKKTPARLAVSATEVAGTAKTVGK
jgi:hypothetical protein